MKENLFDDYNNIFKDYLESKIIEKVLEDEIAKESGSVHYLPNRPVVRQDKEMTKIRAVFDASCAYNGPSLNECFYSALNLLSKIFNILIRFRLSPIRILADIKQAFLNVEMSNDHKDFLRFLWYNANDLKIVIYRLLRVVFCLTSSPFLLNATIRHHLSKCIQFERNFVEKFLEDLYVDDTTSSAKSIEEGKEFYVKAKKMMAEAGFDLRKWKTNSKELQKYFDNNKTPTECNIKIVNDLSYLDIEFCSEESTYARVLGVEWDAERDTFVFRFSKFVDLAKSLSAAKRNILKVSESFYDPLGLFHLLLLGLSVFSNFYVKTVLSGIKRSIMK